MSTKLQHPQSQSPAELVTLRAGQSEDFQRLLDQPFSAFGSIGQFEDAQRMARMLSASTMVPEQYRGVEHLGDCVIALEIANRIGASVLAVMQNLVVIYGKPSWSAQFQISCLNASRRFSPLRYKFTDGEEVEVEYSFTRYVNGAKQRETGKLKVRNRTCIACAIDKSSGELLEGPEVSLKMAIEEGWFTKDGSKWKTMPQLMLRYRAAAFFTRVYAPELTMGIKTAEEVVDMTAPDEPRAANPQAEEQPIFGTAGAGSVAPVTAPTQTAETAPVAPVVSTHTVTEPRHDADGKKAGEVTMTLHFDQGTPQGALGAFLTDAGVSFDKFRHWAGETERLPDSDSFGSWDELPAAFCESLRKDAKSINKCIVRCKS